MAREHQKWLGCVQGGREMSKVARACEMWLGNVKQGRAPPGGAGKAMDKGSGVWWTCGQHLGQRLYVGEPQGTLGHIGMRWAAWMGRGHVIEQGLGHVWGGPGGPWGPVWVQGVSSACGTCWGASVRVWGGLTARPRGAGCIQTGRGMCNEVWAAQGRLVWPWCIGVGWWWRGRCRRGRVCSGGH